MTTQNELELPLYASKPQRRIAGTNAVAVTLYRSGDGSLRQYAIFTADGKRLGSVTSHGSRIGQSAGYHDGLGAYGHRNESYRNLAEAALAFGAKEA